MEHSEIKIVEILGPRMAEGLPIRKVVRSNGSFHLEGWLPAKGWVRGIVDGLDWFHSSDASPEELKRLGVIG